MHSSYSSFSRCTSLNSLLWNFVLSSVIVLLQNCYTCRRQVFHNLFKLFIEEEIDLALTHISSARGNFCGRIKVHQGGSREKVRDEETTQRQENISRISQKISFAKFWGFRKIFEIFPKFSHIFENYWKIKNEHVCVVREDSRPRTKGVF